MSLSKPRAMILDGDVPTPPEPQPDPTWTHAAPPPVAVPQSYTGGYLYSTGGWHHGASTSPPPQCWVTSGD